MSTTKLQTGKASSVTGGLITAASVSLTTTLILTAAIAYLLNKETVSWSQAGYLIMGMLFLAAFLGGKIAYSRIRRQRFVVALMSGLLYWGILLAVTALFIGGQVDAVLETAGIIGAGCGTSVLLFLPKNRKYSGRAGKGYR